MKTNVQIEGAKLFGIKPMGSGCRFGVKVSSKKQDGGFTKGVFINCKHKEMLSEGVNYNLSGFLTDNEWQDRNTLELIVMSAEPVGYTKPQPKPMPKQELPQIDVDDETIPF